MLGALSGGRLECLPAEQTLKWRLPQLQNIEGGFKTWVGGALGEKEVGRQVGTIIQDCLGVGRVGKHCRIFYTGGHHHSRLFGRGEGRKTQLAAASHCFPQPGCQSRAHQPKTQYVRFESGGPLCTSLLQHLERGRDTPGRRSSEGEGGGRCVCVYVRLLRGEG